MKKLFLVVVLIGYFCKANAQEIFIQTLDEDSYSTSELSSWRVFRKYILFPLSKPTFFRDDIKLKWNTIDLIIYQGDNSLLIDKIESYAPDHVIKELTYVAPVIIPMAESPELTLQNVDLRIDKMENRRKVGNSIIVTGVAFCAASLIFSTNGNTDAGMPLAIIGSVLFVGGVITK